MKLPKPWVVALAAALAAAGAWADVQVSGVKFEETADVQGSPVHLNGAGVRYKAVFKVYAAGLYLPKKAGTTEEVLLMPGAKRLAMTTLREVDSSELGRLFMRGMEDNTERSRFGRLIPAVARMGQVFSDNRRLAAGDTITIDWVPGKGTVIAVKGVEQGEPFKDPEFFQALLRIWLGPLPADWKLKEALLGKPA